jgi:cytochrome b6-f complex iron-sulfur subunit
MSDAITLVSRRPFFAGACCAALATVTSACGGDGSPNSPSSPATTLGKLNGQFSGSTVRVNTAGTALDNVGGAALVESVAGVFLLSRNSASTFGALDAVCTHEGCTITGAAGDIYVCPCHGSRYNQNGQVVNGPAKANLRQYATSFSNGIVTISI